jgi:hypothetical protein
MEVHQIAVRITVVVSSIALPVFTLLLLLLLILILILCCCC